MDFHNVLIKNFEGHINHFILKTYCSENKLSEGQCLNENILKTPSMYPS